MILLLSLFLLTGCDFLNSFLSSKTGTSQVEEETDYRELLFLKAQESGFSDTYEEWLRSIKGEKGNDGVGVTSVEKTSTEGLVDTYTITFTNGTTTTFAINNGSKGDQGDKGDKGDTGKPAYEIYVEAHPEYLKSEADWLDDLVNGRLGTEEYYQEYDAENAKENN